MGKIAGTLILIFFCVVVKAQNHSLQKLKIFIDCSNVGCDYTYIKSQIKIVDFLSIPGSADVHILITAQNAAAGGKQYQLIFYGQHTFQNYNDTLFFSTSATATDDEKRIQLANSIMAGISPLVARTAYAPAIIINMQGDDSTNSLPSSVTKGKWNYWVFNTGVDGHLNIDKNYKSNAYSADFSANRTTRKIKMDFNIYGSKNRSVYEYSDSSGTSKIIVKNSNYGISNNLVKSLTTHWSYGYRISFSNNTFSNFKRKLYFSPAIEYNFFPYSQVSNRFFVLRYGIDMAGNQYYDTTIYDKIHETLYGHRLSATLILNQKWGRFYSNIYYRNYFNDWKMNNMGINLNVNVRISGGLSFYINTSGSIVHDQIYLAKGNVSEQDLLVKTRELASSFNYNVNFGVNFKFGSKLNNFINARFQGYDGF